jgi:thiol-disulfide isomerase/thioredoxin
LIKIRSQLFVQPSQVHISMKSFRVVSILLIITLTNAKGQILDNMAEKLKSLKNIGYTDVLKFKFSFEEDFSIDTLKSLVTFYAGEKQTGGYYLLESPATKFLYDGNKLVILDEKDSTYRIKEDAISGQNTCTLLYWAQKASFYSKHHPSKVMQLSDTTVKSIPCSHMRIIISDTLRKGVRCYNIADFFIDKKTSLPLIIENEMQGFSDDGTVLGIEEIHNYSNYKTFAKNSPDLSIVTIPKHFRLPSKGKSIPFLANGTLAPEIALTDMEGKPFDIKSLKGKTVLFNFTSVSCPHCVSAAEMLNKLTSLYKDDNLIIANIYPLDDKEAITKFNKRFKVTSLTLTTDSKVEDIYQFQGYPSFYLLDKQGTISQAFGGYYPELSDQLIDKINSIK